MGNRLSNFLTIFDNLGDTSDIDMIFGEANAMKNLNHKNIV